MQITPAQVLSELQYHIGKTTGIHVRELTQRITGQLVTEPQERKVRQVISDLRMDGAHICGHPATGYFMAATPEELEETLQFLRSRSLTTLMLESRMRRVSMPDLLGQIHLPT